jgi:predicted porin
VPANAEELLRMRGRGWLVSGYSIGDGNTPEHGVPLANAIRWDTGVQVHAASSRIDGTVALTAGTLSNPVFTDDNSGRQLVGRLGVRATRGLFVGASAARGPFLADPASRGAVGDGQNGHFTQSAFGIDLEYARDHFQVRGETIVSRWRVPAVHMSLITEPLRATATYVEGRYKIRPGLYAAARVDRLGFSEIDSTQGRGTWEAPVRRIEVGGGYYLQRNLILKASYQHNARKGGRVTGQQFVSGQLVFWF